jgi:hypothetical protein
MTILVPQYISRKAFYSAQFLLFGSIRAYIHCLYTLSGLFFLLYLSTLAHWNKIENGIIKKIDISLAASVLFHISFIDTQYFDVVYKYLWFGSVFISSTVFFINETVFYYRLQNTILGTKERENAYIQSAYVHMFFLHAVPPLTCAYCAKMSTKLFSKCIL